MSTRRIREIRKLIIAGENVGREEILTAWQEDLEDMDERIETVTQELEDAVTLLRKPAAWGDCRRGCPPAYLDKAGFCSPACALGAPRGKFVTTLSNDAQETMFWRETHGF
jgi:hypothetical protein